MLETGSAHWLETAPPGRAQQMNAGAAGSDGEILLFLHADSRLPEGWEQIIREALGDDRAVGGCFQLGLEGGFAYRLIGWMSTFRSRFLGITYGDQGIFARRSAFDAVHGYPNRKIFEDSEFCDALRKLGHFRMVDGVLVTSTRRWEQWGILHTVLKMWWLRLLYRLSVSDEALSRRYRQVR